ncbi:MAG: glycosyltransferase family 4 protein [Bacteroidia bacterium]|nr:glycosyltransferase family 4 protein [Bacteroidia bacterium]
MKVRILIVGPLPEPTTGVSLANKIVVDNLTDEGRLHVDSINTAYSRFEENHGSFSVGKVFFFLRLNLLAYKIFKADKIYITPGQTFFGVLKYSVFILLSWILGKEIIIHVHGNHLGKEFLSLKGLKRNIFRSLLNKTTKGIVLSESLRGNMIPFIESSKIFTLYNFVEEYLFPTRPEINHKAANFVPRIVFLSNLMEGKGIFDLLEALTILESNGFKYEAKIAGNIDSKQEPRIMSYFKNLEHAEYCGVVKGEDKKELLLWGTIFVLATDYVMEGQPISILEAMATGNMILTTQHAGIPDIFKDAKNGFFVEKNNPKSIVEKINKIIVERELCSQIIVGNYLEAKNKYRVNDFIHGLEEILNA